MGDEPPARPELSAFGVEGPVWLPVQSPARALFAQGRAAKLLFPAGSVGYAEQPRTPESQLPDMPGRLSRALPLFLAESAFLHMGVDTLAIVPWVKRHGFAVLRREWTEADAAEQARSAGAFAAVMLHLQQSGDAIDASLQVLRTGEGAAQAPTPPHFSVRVRGRDVPDGTDEIDGPQIGNLALQLWSQMAHRLLPFTAAGSGQGPIPATLLDAARYRVPAGPALGNYLLRLEQLLGVRCMGSDRPGRSLLSGEREMVRGQLELARSLPESLPLRLILHETLLRMRDLRPEIVAEFRSPVERLQQRSPLQDGAATAVLERQLGTIYGRPQ